jgi:hypothetical protein
MPKTIEEDGTEDTPGNQVSKAVDLLYKWLSARTNYIEGKAK